MPDQEPQTSNEGYSPEPRSASTPPPDQGPPVVSGYRILGVLGEGGMGIVYLAEQLEPVRRRVALKVIKPGMDSKSVLARFEAERQALAVMDHPSVAHVFDAGTTDRGHPYFVMEHVQGLPITSFCDQNRLSLEDRLGLFIQVCDAVQHAHQKGIIHRDIKPTNVLVKLDGNLPHPRIIDFGVAKALNQQLNAQTFYTERGELIGTPEYMSPEQAEMSALDVDTRSDIFSLGVMLYELLTGALPFDPSTLRAAGIGEIQRIIREVEPPKPSTKLSSVSAARRASGDAEHHGDRPAAQASELARRVRGDLDWITMKAMAKDRRRRYDSASRLATDIQHFLRHEPIEARPPSVSYRCSRFVRRHRTASAAAVVVVVALIAGLSLATYGLVRAEQARRLAERKATEASEVSRFLQDLFMSIRPSTARTSQPTLRDILAHADAKLDAPGSRLPAVESVIRDTIGATYYALGDFDQADRHLTRSAELLAQHEGIDRSSGVSSVASLGVMRLEQGRLEEAEQLLVSALDELRRISGLRDRKTLYAVQNLGYLYLRQGRYDEAEPLLHEAFDGQRERVGADHEDAIRAGVLIAELHLYRAQREQAKLLTEDLIERVERSIGSDHILAAQVYQMDGWAAHQLGDYPHAEERYRQTLAIRDQALGSGHPDTLFIRSVLANLLRNLGRNDDALALSEEVYDALRETVGDENPRTINALMTLASIVASLGQRERATGLLERAVELSEGVYGPDAAPTANAINDLAGMYWITDPERAVAMYQRVRDIRAVAFGPDHLETAKARMNVGLAMGRTGALDEAEEELRASVEAFDRIIGPESEDSINANSNLITVLLDQEDYDEASGVIDQTLATIESLDENDSWVTFLTVHRIRMLREKGELDEAIREAHRAIEVALGPNPEGNSVVAEILRQMGFALITRRDVGEADDAFTRARTMLLAYWGDEFQDTEFHETIAKAFEHAGFDDEARHWRDRLAQLDEAGDKPAQ